MALPIVPSEFFPFVTASVSAARLPTLSSATSTRQDLSALKPASCVLKCVSITAEDFPDTLLYGIFLVSAESSGAKLPTTFTFSPTARVPATSLSIWVDVGFGYVSETSKIA